MADTGAPFFLPYPLPSDLVRDGADDIKALAEAMAQALEDIPVTIKKVEAFTGSGTWTVPAGVTYAVAHMLGGGAGITGRTSTTGVAGADGGASSVAFSSGTVTANGGVSVKGLGSGTAAAAITVAGTDAAANSGAPGSTPMRNDDSALVTSNASPAGAIPLGNGSRVVAGAAVTPAETISVTVGAGGTGGGTTTKGGDGGSGYVYIEYFEEV